MARHLRLEECRDAEHRVAAAHDAGYARGTGGRFVVTAAGGGHLRAAPGSAQQCGVWPNRQHQCEGQRNYSKHVMLTGVNGKKDANEHREQGLKKQRPRLDFQAADNLRLPGISRWSAENPAVS